MEKTNQRTISSFDHLIDTVLSEGVPYVQGFDLEKSMREVLGRREPNLDINAIYESVKQILTSEKIIVATGHHQWKFYITQKGKQIIQNGGWIEYQKREEKVLQLEIEKLQWDSQVSKWQARLWWFPFLSGGLGIVFSIVALSTKEKPTLGKISKENITQPRLDNRTTLESTSPSSQGLLADSNLLQIKTDSQPILKN